MNIASNIQNDTIEGRFSLIINEYEGKISIIINYSAPQHLHTASRLHGCPNQMRIKCTPQRIVKLAKEILAHFNKKMKYKEWEPTFRDFEKKVKEKYGDDGLYMWLLDWLRLPWNEKHAHNLYEWLKLGEELGMRIGKNAE